MVEIIKQVGWETVKVLSYLVWMQAVQAICEEHTNAIVPSNRRVVKVHLPSCIKEGPHVCYNPETMFHLNVYSQHLCTGTHIQEGTKNVGSKPKSWVTKAQHTSHQILRGGLAIF